MADKPTASSDPAANNVGKALYTEKALWQWTIGGAMAGALIAGLAGFAVGSAFGSSAHARSSKSVLATSVSTVTTTQYVRDTIAAGPAPSDFPTTTTNTTTETTRHPQTYGGGNQVLSVGSRPHGGLTHAIPPGRYRVTIDDRDSGAWMRCSSELCGLSYMQNVLAIENCSGPNYSAVMEVEPTDAAIAIVGITLTSVS